ncbi:MAG: ABC transporter permease [Oscillospiraceae bacterium]|nr:ABC transporter permease [Oscillospiraceae bacterium]
MKRLTVNRVAGAGVRANLREYLGLSAGILAAIFLTCTVVLTLLAVYDGREAELERKYGRQDAFVYDAGPETGAELLRQGLAAETGTLYYLGRSGDCAVGYYDAGGAALANRQLWSGRMPEAPGELALELDLLDKLFPEAELGDSVSLEIQPIEGAKETRSFTLVGVVLSQGRLSDEELRADLPKRENVGLPQLFVSASEPPFATGRAVRILLLRYAKGTGLNDVTAAAGGLPVFRISLWGWFYFGPAEHMEDMGTLEYLANYDGFGVLALLLGGSLLLFSMLGVTAALGSQLSRKREEIAMLRAVGATRRQIRRIFGRESLLLALLLSPLGVGAAVLAVYGLCTLAPDSLRFWLPPLALIPMLALSFLFILLASFLPLLRASRTRPMSLIRDTETLRKAKRFRPKASFRPARLMALRRLRLHPVRQLGICLLTGLLCLMSFAGVLLGGEAIRAILPRENEPDLYLYGGADMIGFGMPDDLRTSIPLRALSEADLAQIRALPGVSSLRTRYRTVVLLTDRPEGNYLEQCAKNAIFYMFNQSGANAPGVRAAMELLDLETPPFALPVLLTDEPERYVPNLTAGAIDRAALDAGREVLLCLPDYYVGKNEYGDPAISMMPQPAEEGWLHISNDSFLPGQALSLCQLCDEAEDGATTRSKAEYLSLYRQAERCQATVKLGGVISSLFVGVEPRYGYQEPQLITTPAGFRALGLRLGVLEDINVFLKPGTDEATCAYDFGRLERIAARVGTLNVYNQIKDRAESRRKGQAGLIAIAAVVGLLIWFSVRVVAGTGIRQMEAERRTIGTLRAVGMSGSVLRAGYGLQSAVQVGVGWLLAAVVCLLVSMRIVENTVRETLPLAFLAQLLIALLTALLCWASIARRSRRLLRRSVIENIREVG